MSCSYSTLFHLHYLRSNIDKQRLLLLLKHCGLSSFLCFFRQARLLPNPFFVQAFNSFMMLNFKSNVHKCADKGEVVLVVSGHRGNCLCLQHSTVLQAAEMTYGN
jgi:hypothetical protein